MTANATGNPGELFEKVPLTLIFIMRITAILMLFLNGTVLLCLCVKKQNMPRVYTFQIFCLCLTDNMAGTALLTLSFVDYDWFRTDFTWCCFLLGFFISSQSVTLYNVTAICINRFIIMLRMETVDHHLTRAKVMAFSIAALTLGIVFCSLPFFSLRSTHEYHQYMAGCSLPAVFRENFEYSMKMYLGTYLIPLLITNLLYTCLLCMLRRSRRRTRPGVHSVADKIITSPIIKMRTVILENERNGQGSSGDRIDSAIAGPSNLNPGRQDVTLSTSKLVNTPRTSRGGNDNVCIATLTRQVPVEHSNLNSVPSTPGSSSERQTHQRKAFTLLGLILLSLNICTWPSIIVLLLGSANGSSNLSRGSIIPLFSTISFNSIINPILYTVRVGEFRKAVCDTFRCPQFRFR